VGNQYQVQVRENPQGRVLGTRGPYSTVAGARQAAQTIANANPRKAVVIVAKKPAKKPAKTRRRKKNAPLKGAQAVWNALDAGTVPETVDEHALAELTLYADNTERLYKLKMTIAAALVKKRRSGKYDWRKAPQAFTYLADAAAKAYTKEFDSPDHGSFGAFDVPTRAAAAYQWAREEAAGELRENRGRANPHGMTGWSGGAAAPFTVEVIDMINDKYVQQLRGGNTQQEALALADKMQAKYHATKAGFDRYIVQIVGEYAGRRSVAHAWGGGHGGTFKNKGLKANKGRKAKRKAKRQHYQGHVINEQNGVYVVEPYGQQFRSLADAKRWLDQHVAASSTAYRTNK